MKKLLLALTLLGAAGPVIHGQETPAEKTAARTPDQVVAMYQKRLGLTEEQKTKLKPIVADRQAKMVALRNDTALTPHEKMMKMESLRSESNRRMNDVFTGDQQKKYAALEAEEREKMKERRTDSN